MERSSSFSSPAAIADTARRAGGVRLPGLSDCWLRITDTARCALCSVRHQYPEESGSAVPIVTFAVANHARCGAQLWQMLIETAAVPCAVGLKRPETPWCAVRLEPGLVICQQLEAEALGDLERCIAWAWLDGRTRAGVS